MTTVKNMNRMMIAEGEAGEVEVLIYGKIGASGYNEYGNYESNTDQERFAEYVEYLAQNYEMIRLRLNSVGGSPHHSDGIVATIRKHVSKIHVYVDGIAASAAADIFFAVPKSQRHMAVNAKLMIHRTSGMCMGDWETMTNTADMLKAYDESCAAAIASGTDMTDKEVLKQFLDGKDHWLTAQKCLEMGFIDSIETYQAENVPADAESMTEAQLMRYFEQKFETKTPKAGILDNIKRLIGLEKTGDDAPLTDIISQEKEEEIMNAEALKEALRTGALSLDDVKRTVEEAEKAAPVTLEAIGRMFEEKLSPLQAENTRLSAEVARLGGLPAGEGAPQAAGVDPDTLVDTVPEEIAAANRAFKSAIN